MPVNLFIKNEPADLDTDTKIALTFQLHNLNNLESRQGNYSNEFSLPLTAKNKRLIGWANTMPTNSPLAYSKAESTLMINGIQNIPGFIVIESTTDTKINCTFYSGNTNFFEELNDNTLNNLSLTAYNHYWGISGTNNTFTNKTNTEGFTYPIIDFSVDANKPTLPYSSRTINPKLLRPALFGSAILNAIESFTGYTFSGNFLSDTRYLNEIIIITTDELIHTETWNIQQQFAAEKTADQTVLAGDTDKITFTTETTDPGNNFTNPDYSIPAMGSYVFNFNYRINVAGVDSPRPLLKIVKENALGEKTVLAKATIEGLTMIFPETLSTGTIEASQGDKIYVEITAGANNATFETDIYGGQFSCTSVKNTAINYNNTFEFTGNLPDISLKNYIKALCQRYNLLLYTDELAKTVEFIPFKVIYKNTPYAIDWTDKLHNVKQEIEFHPTEYGLTNIFNFAANNKTAEVLGRGTFTVNDETLNNKQVTITQPFAAMPMVTRLNGLDVPNCKLLEYDNGSEQFIPKNTKPCIAYLNRQLLNDDPIIYNDGTSTASDGNTHEPLAWFILPDKPFNLGFDNSLLADNYAELNYTLTQYKKLTAYFNLSAVDVLTFDFKYPIYLKQFSAYFYVNSIINYLPNKLTKVELIRM